MIHVDPKPEPAVFDARVRTPGQAFLLVTPHPTSKEFEKHSYWRRVLKELHTAYRGICAYSCHWIPYDTGSDTVEHFLAKIDFPNQAYEWTNYRLVCGTLNSRKGTHDNILDPFQITNGWFVIDFPSLLVKPSRDINEPLDRQIKNTIKKLGLNDEDTCLKSREHYLRQYCINQVSFAYLQEEAPFLAMELERQRLVDSINDIMGYAV